MQQLLGTRTTDLDSIRLRDLFLQRLPTNVRMILISVGETNLSKLAELADWLMAVPSSPASAVQAEPATSDQLQEIRDEISRLAVTVAALQESVSHPSNQKSCGQAPAWNPFAQPFVQPSALSTTEPAADSAAESP
ncbi:hypothetical protein HPB47_008683 [Ixodes persulcatus]|uniref:Uncharacterized protein n=1 Tax=Ixodes persulcatus TaxID=34615 RepID=A0AC60P421_IXOPE|nr:hypothetical protein HPB47_008683 [Ixodes persulcatus]